MLKKVITTTLISAVLVSGLFMSTAWAGSAAVINGKDVSNAIATYKTDSDGNIEKKVVMIPLREAVQYLGYSVSWDGHGVAATVSNDTQEIIVGPQDKAILIYGKQSASIGELDVPTQIMDGHIYIETDFFTKYLGAKLSK